MKFTINVIMVLALLLMFTRCKITVGNKVIKDSWLILKTDK